MKKHLLSIILIFIMLFSLSITAFAAKTSSFDNEESGNELHGLSYEPPFNPQTRGFSAPNITTLWNINTKGPGTMSGYCTSDRKLYSNHMYYGKTDYSITIKNHLSQPLTVNIRSYLGGGILKSTTVSANATIYYGFKTDIPNSYFYFQFDGPCNIDGTIK